MCDVLKEIYKKIYDESFDYSNLENRIKLQKAVYFLENMGIHVGDYSFSWNKYGPYSLGLDSDAQKCDLQAEKEIIFSDIAENCFGKIKEFIQQQISYTCVQWLECIAALHYLKNVLRYNEDDLFAQLQDRKPYLSNEEANKKALSIMREIKVNF